MRRLVLLLLGGFSPCRVTAMRAADWADGFYEGATGEKVPPRELSWLDRWELCNARGHVMLVNGEWPLP